MARIQFFYDGNKRTGRLMMNGVLLTNGLPVINLPASKQLVG
jgi:Fic family protein